MCKCISKSKALLAFWVDVLGNNKMQFIYHKETYLDEILLFVTCEFRLMPEVCLEDEDSMLYTKKQRQSLYKQLSEPTLPNRSTKRLCEALLNFKVTLDGKLQRKNLNDLR